MSNKKFLIILISCFIYLIGSTNSYPFPMVAIIYTYAVDRVVNGEDIVNNQIDDWQVIDGKNLELSDDEMITYVERIAPIPLSNAEKRTQEIFWGFWPNDSTVVFDYDKPLNDITMSFYDIPRVVKNKIKENLQVVLRNNVYNKP